MDILIEKDHDSAFFSQYLGRKNKKGRSIALIMEYLPNPTLNQIISLAKLEESKLLAYSYDILDVLKALKRHRILHRDLRTANIVI